MEFVSRGSNKIVKQLAGQLHKDDLPQVDLFSRKNIFC